MAVVTLTSCGFTMTHLAAGNPGFDVAYESGTTIYILSTNENSDWLTGDTTYVSYQMAYKSTDGGATYSISDADPEPVMGAGKPHTASIQFGAMVYCWGSRNEQDLSPYTADQTLTLLPFSLSTGTFDTLITGGPNFGPQKTAGEQPTNSRLIARAFVYGSDIYFIHTSASEKVSTVWRQRVSVTQYTPGTDTWGSTTQLNGMTGEEYHFLPMGIVVDDSGNVYQFFIQVSYPSLFLCTLFCQMNSGSPVQVATSLRQYAGSMGASKPVLFTYDGTQYIGITAPKDGSNNELYFYYSESGANSWTEETISTNVNYHASANMGEMSAALAVSPNGDLYAFWYRQSSDYIEPHDLWIEYSKRSPGAWGTVTLAGNLPALDPADEAFTHSVHVVPGTNGFIIAVGIDGGSEAVGGFSTRIDTFIVTPSGYEGGGNGNGGQEECTVLVAPSITPDIQWDDEPLEQ